MVGPAASCQVAILPYSVNATSNVTLASAAQLNATLLNSSTLAVATASDGGLQFAADFNGSSLALASLHPSNASSACRDTFSGTPPLYTLRLLLPANSTGARSIDAGAAAHAGAAAAVAAAAAQQREASLADAEAATRIAFALAGVNVSAMGAQWSSAMSNSGNLSALGLLPLDLVFHAALRDRALGVAALVADFQVGSLLALGSSVLTPLITASQQQTTAPAAAAAASSALGAQLVALGQQRLAAAAAGAYQILPPQVPTAAAGSTASSVNSIIATTAVRQTPLTDASFVASIITAAAASVLDARTAGLAQSAVTATAEVVAGFVRYAEQFKVAAAAVVAAADASSGSALKAAAAVAVSPLATAANPLEALLTLAELAAVQQQAAASVAAVGAGSQQAAVLAQYAYSTLGERLLQVQANVTAVHGALGLSLPSAPNQDTAAVAQAVGPLAGCVGLATDRWAGVSQQQQSFVSGAYGRFTITQRGTGPVTVWPLQGCRDVLTGLPLHLPLLTLATPGARLALTPMGLLTQGLYDMQGAQGPATLAPQLHDASFAALGLDASQYSQLLPLTVSSGSNASSGAAAWLAQPLSAAVAAAGGQITGLMYLSRALFTRSAYYVYGLDSAQEASDLVVRLTSVALASEAMGSSSASSSSSTYWSPPALTVSAVNLGDGATLQRILAAVRAACPASTAAVTSSTSAAAAAAAADGMWPPALLTDAADFDLVLGVLVGLLAGVNGALQGYKEQAVAAAAAASGSSPAQLNSTWNQTGAMLNVSGLAYVAQVPLYSGAVLVMNTSANAGAYRVELLQQLQAALGSGTSSTGGLQQTLAAVVRGSGSTAAAIPAATALCAAASSLCATAAAGTPPAAAGSSPPSSGGSSSSSTGSPSAGSSSPSSSSSSSKLGLGIGVAVGIGVPVALILGWVAFRCVQEKRVTQAVARYKEHEMQLAHAHDGTMVRASYGHPDAAAPGNGLAAKPVYASPAAAAAATASTAAYTPYGSPQQQLYAQQPLLTGGASPYHLPYHQQHLAAPAAPTASPAGAHNRVSPSRDLGMSLGARGSPYSSGSPYTGSPMHSGRPLLPPLPPSAQGSPLNHTYPPPRVPVDRAGNWAGSPPVQGRLSLGPQAGSPPVYGRSSLGPQAASQQHQAPPDAAGGRNTAPNSFSSGRSGYVPHQQQPQPLTAEQQQLLLQPVQPHGQQQQQQQQQQQPVQQQYPQYQQQQPAQQQQQPQQALPANLWQQQQQQQQYVGGSPAAPQVQVPQWAGINSPPSPL